MHKQTFSLGSNSPTQTCRHHQNPERPACIPSCFALLFVCATVKYEKKKRRKRVRREKTGRTAKGAASISLCAAAATQTCTTTTLALENAVNAPAQNHHQRTITQKVFSRPTRLSTQKLQIHTVSHAHIHPNTHSTAQHSTAHTHTARKTRGVWPLASFSAT